MITLQDKELLAKKGISEEQIAEQLACFEKGFPYLKLSAAASVEQHILYNRVQPEDIPLYAVVLYRVYKMCFQLSAIALVERLSGKLQ